MKRRSLGNAVHKHSSMSVPVVVASEGSEAFNTCCVPNAQLHTNITHIMIDIVRDEQVHGFYLPLYKPQLSRVGTT